MTDERDESSAAVTLAALVSGNAEYEHAMAAVQRSHRFPVHLFVQIENLANMGGVPVSLIINKLIECGLEAVKEKLSADAVDKLGIASKKQFERPMVTDRVATKKRRRKVSGARQ